MPLVNQRGARIPGAMGAPPPDAPREYSQPEDPRALAERVAMARKNEQVLQPLIVAPASAVPSARPAARPSTTTTPVRTATIVQPSQSRLRVPGRPAVSSTPAASVPVTTIILTDAVPAALTTQVSTAMPGSDQPPMRGIAPAVSSVSSAPPASLLNERPARPPVDPATAAYLDSPVARAARELHASRQLTHQPAASDSDSPSRGIPSAVADPGKQITGGFGDAGDALYFPLDGSELRELVRGLMSIIDEQITNDLRFSMAICYPRVTARVVVEIDAFAQDGGKYDSSFTIEKVKAHEKTPLDVARSRADSVCFVVKADRVEMTADGQSISPPNAIRQDLGLVVPYKQAVSTPHGRLIVDLPA